MAEAQKKKQPEPVAYDRYWRVPVYNEQLPENVEGQYGEYNLENSLGRELAKLKGSDKYINISESIPQSVEGSEPNPRQSIMKHELAHVLQERMAGKGGISPDMKGPLPDMGGGVLGWFLSALKDPQRAKEAAMAYQTKLDQAVGGIEGDAYLLSGTVGDTKGLPRDREQEEVLRRMQIEELERKGQGKYTPIWKK